VKSTGTCTQSHSAGLRAGKRPFGLPLGRVSRTFSGGPPCENGAQCCRASQRGHSKYRIRGWTSRL